MSWVTLLAQKVGTSEPGLRLVLGQLSGYPFFLIHRHFLRQSSATVQHLYFFLTGFLMSWWALGFESVFHSSTCVLITYLTLKLLGTNRGTALGLFIFNLGYLFTGYVSYSTREYDITWTMPGCVICLRLIGLAIDCWDGSKPPEHLSKDQALAALPVVPSLLECFSHSFFIGGYFVGPQFSMRKYQNFIIRNQQEPNLASPVSFGLRRLGIGALYMLGHLIGSGYFPESWVTTEDFVKTPFLLRSVYMFCWVKVILAKYIGAWLFAEGACIVSGLAYNGKDEKTGEVLWNGMANVKLRRFESCLRFQHLIESFNINTNHWVFSYVYKRLRFLNNKKLSQLGVLIFLAVWHGYHSGYYVTFFNEFIVMYVEDEFMRLFDKIPGLKSVYENPVGNIVCKLFAFCYVALLLPHCFIAFALLKRDRYWPVLKATGFFLWAFCAVGFVVVSILRAIFAERKDKKKE